MISPNKINAKYMGAKICTFSPIENESFEIKAFGHYVYLCNFPLLKTTSAF